MKHKITTIILFLTTCLFLIAISGCDAMSRNSDVSLQLDQSISEEITPTTTSISALVTTENLSAETQSMTESMGSTDVIELMKLLADTTEYEEREKLKEKYCIDAFQGYNNSHLKGVHYIVFTDKFELSGLHYGLTPNQVMQMESTARFFEFEDIYEENTVDYILKRISYYLQYEQIAGTIMILPKDSYYIVGISQGAESPFVKMAAIKDLSMDDAGKTVIGDYETPKLPPDLFFTKPQPVQVNGFETYHVDLIKETKQYGKSVLASYYVERITAEAFSINANDSSPVDSEQEYRLTDESLDVNRFMNPYPEQRKFRFLKNNYPMDDYLEFTVDNAQIFIMNKLKGESIHLPVSTRQMQNIQEFIKIYDLEQLFIVEPLDVNSANNLLTKKYSLKALFGLNQDYEFVKTQNTYFDLAMLTVGFNQETEKITEIHIEPKYSSEMVEQKRALSLSDFNIGPLQACMKQEDFLEAINKEGADAKTVENLKNMIRKLDFGTFEYNGIKIKNHPLAECFPCFTYEGSEQNYKTSRNIGVGSTKQDVLNAYNAPDIGLAQSDQWEYLLDTPYWNLTDDPVINMGDTMKFIFKDNAVISIQVYVYISSS